MRASFLKDLFNPRRVRTTVFSSWVAGIFVPNASTPPAEESPDFGTIFSTPPSGIMEGRAVFPTTKQWLFASTAESPVIHPVVGGPQVALARMQRHIVAPPKPQRPLHRPADDILLFHASRPRSNTMHTRPEAPDRANSCPPSALPRTSHRHRAPSPPIDPKFLAPPGGRPRRKTLTGSSPVPDRPVSDLPTSRTPREIPRTTAAKEDCPDSTTKEHQHQFAAVYTMKSSIATTNPQLAAASIVYSTAKATTAKFVVDQPVSSTQPLVPRTRSATQGGKATDIRQSTNPEKGDQVRSVRPPTRPSGERPVEAQEPDEATQAALSSPPCTTADRPLIGLGLFSEGKDIAVEPRPRWL